MKLTRRHAISLVLPLLLCAGTTMPGCASVPVPLSVASAARLTRAPTLNFGDQIYAGEVAPRGQNSPLFRYQRFVEKHGDGWVSTHLTRSVEADAVLVLQQATHDDDYRVTRFEEVHQQTGLASVVLVDADGSILFSVERGEHTEESSEGIGDPVVVGPTLFGYARAHLDELRKGSELPIRFAVADQGRSYEFTLRLEQEEGRLVVVMEASSFFVRLAIDAMRIEFDRDGGSVLSYQGRVPARLSGLQAFDADVLYSYSVARFR